MKFCDKHFITGCGPPQELHACVWRYLRYERFPVFHFVARFSRRLGVSRGWIFSMDSNLLVITRVADSMTYLDLGRPVGHIRVLCGWFVIAVEEPDVPRGLPEATLPALSPCIGVKSGITAGVTAEQTCRLGRHIHK